MSKFFTDLSSAINLNDFQVSVCGDTVKIYADYMRDCCVIFKSTDISRLEFDNHTSFEVQKSGHYQIAVHGVIDAVMLADKIGNGTVIVK